MNQRDPAAVRWAAIQLTRLLGVGFALAGLLIIAGRTAMLAWIPDWVGWLLLATGLIDLLVIPQMLARRWRSREP